MLKRPIRARCALNLFLAALLLINLTPGISAEEIKRPPAQDFQEFLNSFQQNIKLVKLKNGLELIMVKRSFAPTVSCYIKFKVGSVDENNANSGIAHMLEHMLFKGTKIVGTKDYKKEEKYIHAVNDMARHLDLARRRMIKAKRTGEKLAAMREIQLWQKRLAYVTRYARQFSREDEDSYIYGLHGEKGFNAYTSRDLTNYQVQLPANRLEVWARLESDRLKNSVLRGFYTERYVVAEERRMRTDNVARNLLFEKFISKAYGAHPYGRPVIGPMKSIQFLNYDQAYKFYKNYYAPNNTVIALVGDINFDSTEKLVRRYFGDMKPRRIPKLKVKTPPARTEPLYVDHAGKGSPLMLMSWFKPNFPDPDDLPLSLLGDILAYGRDSRLFKKLVLKERLASEISVFADYPGERYTNLFTVYTTPAPGKSYDALEKSILEEFANVRKNGVTEAELLRVKRKLQSDFVYGLRSNARLADRLSYFQLLVGDYKVIFDFYGKLDQITTADIQAAARKHLGSEKRIIGRLVKPKRRAATINPGPGAK